MRQGFVSGGRGWCVGFLGDECGVRWLEGVLGFGFG